MNSVVTVNFGNEVIGPRGGGRTELSLGAYRYRITGGGMELSSKAKIPQLVVQYQVVAVGRGGNAEEVGLSTSYAMSLPEGEDFSDQTEAGRRNRPRVAEIKSFLVSAGILDVTQATQLQGNRPLNMAEFVNREGVLFFEPSWGKNADGKDSYSNVTWLDGTTGEQAMAGTYRPRLKRDSSTSTNVNTAQTLGGLPMGGPGITPPGLDRVLATGTAPGVNGGFPTGGSSLGATSNAAFGSLLS